MSESCDTMSCNERFQENGTNEIGLKWGNNRTWRSLVICDTKPCLFQPHNSHQRWPWLHLLCSNPIQCNPIYWTVKKFDPTQLKPNQSVQLIHASNKCTFLLCNYKATQQNQYTSGSQDIWNPTHSQALICKTKPTRIVTETLLQNNIENADLQSDQHIGGVYSHRQNFRRFTAVN